MTSKIVQFRNDPNKCIEMTPNIVQFRDDTNKCIEMTSKIVQFRDDPKIYLLFFQTPKIFIFLKTQKILKFKSLNQKNGRSLRQSTWASPHPLTKQNILYDVCNVKLQLYAKGSAWHEGERTSILTHLAYRANGNKLWYIGQ